MQSPPQRTGVALVRNIASIGMARISAIVLDGAAYVLIARYLGPADYGFYIAIVAAVSLVDVASDLTVFDIAVRETSKELNRAGAWLGASSALRALLGLAGTVAFLAYAFLGPPSTHPQVRTAALLGALALPIGSLRMPLALFRAQLRMQYEFLLLAATRLLNLLLVIGCISAHYGLLQLVSAIVVSRAFLAITAWTLCLRIFRVRPEFHFADLRMMFIECVPMAISGVFVAIQLKIDLLLVTMMRGAEQGGLYASVAQLPEYLLYVPVIVTTPLLPLLSRAFANGEKTEFAKLFEKLIVGIVLLSGPAVIVCFFFPKPLVVLLFGQKFAGAAAFFPWIVVSVAFMWISHALAVATVAAGLQKNFIWIQTVCVAVFLGVCFTFIPGMGAWGAAGARVAATFLAPLFTVAVLWRHMDLRLPWKPLLSAALGTIALVVVIMLTRSASFYLSIACALVAYVAIIASAYALRARSEVTL